MVTRIPMILKTGLLVCLLPLLCACTTGRFARQNDDSAGIGARLDTVEKQVACQTDQLDLLVETCAQSHLLLAELHRLLLQDIEQNTRSFEYLEELIRQMHNDIRRRLSALRGNADPGFDMPSGHQPVGTDKLLVGEIEKVRLTPPGRLFHARIDTGATTSSLDARDIEPFERNGSPWVRFKIKDPENESLYEVEKPLVRRVRIIQSTAGEADRRPVVKLQFQVGRITLIEEFTLVDRTHLDYQVLIGRNILRDLMVVDVARKFMVPLPEPESGGNSTR